MFAAAAVPDVLIAEADPWTADLLAQLILAARPDAHIQRFTDGEAALARCRRKLPDLVIADGELPGLDGIELLRQLRRHPRIPALPCVLISSRVDAASVRAVLPLAPAAYLAKPFNAEQLRQRLDSLLPAACNESLAAPAALLVSDLGQYLDDVREEGQGAPLLADIRSAVSSSLQAYDTDLGQLAREFARDPQITARLIAAANSAAEQRGGICQTLTQALQRIGVARALNLVLGMAVQRNARLQDPRLAELASQVGEQAQRSAELAHWLAAQLRLDHELCYTAGLLHNIGELALLRSLQDWQEATIKTLLNRLLNKGAISAQKEGRRYLYSPLLKREDWVLKESRGLLDRLFDGRVAPLVAHFSQHQELSRNDIAELRKLIEGLDDAQH